MTKKAETQFALLAAAFTADEKMARQVCSLLANGHIDEPAAKLMLGLVRDGHLKSVLEVRWQQYPRWYFSSPLSAGTTTIGPRPDTNLPYITCNAANLTGKENSSLTAMARELVGSAA